MSDIGKEIELKFSRSSKRSVMLSIIGSVCAISGLLISFFSWYGASNKNIILKNEISQSNRPIISSAPSTNNADEFLRLGQYRKAIEYIGYPLHSSYMPLTL